MKEDEKTSENNTGVARGSPGNTLQR